MPIRSIDTNGKTVRIVVADDLTDTDLGLVTEALRHGARGASVEVDFRRARHVAPANLHALTSLLTALGMSYTFAGLSASNDRVLGYLRRTGEDGTPDADS